MSRGSPDAFATECDALIVAQGLVPSGCVVEASLARNDQVRLTLHRLTSPAAQQLFSSHQTLPAEVHLFPKTPDDGAHIHCKGTVSPAANGSFAFSGTVSGAPASARPTESFRECRSVLADTSALESIQSRYRERLRQFLQQLFAQFMAHALDGIEADIQNNAELRELTRLKDMRYIFQSREQQMFGDFLNQFGANHRVLEPDPASASAQSELQMLSQEVFEDWLELQTVAAKAMAVRPHAVFLTNQLLNQLFGRDTRDHTNPLAPRSLCLCLQYMANRLGIATAHRNTLYGAFQSALLNTWPDAMDSLVAELRQTGLHALEPGELPANWSHRDSPGDSEASAPETLTDEMASPDSNEARAPASDARSQSLFRLMGLAHGMTDGGPEWHSTNPQLAQSLRSHRTELRDHLRGSGYDIAQAIRELAANDPALADAVDESCIEKADLVDRLFAPLQAQGEVSDRLREQLEQLRLPVFESLLETSDFLSEETHPAREIVNNLIHLCVAERVPNQKLEATLSALIDELLEAADPQRLEPLSDKLRKLVDRQHLSFERNAERLAKTLDGKQRLASTRRAVQARLNDLLGQSQVPQIVLDLLNAGWEHHLVLTSLREGVDSPRCQELFHVVEELRDWLLSDGDRDDLNMERELESGVTLQYIERELREAGGSAPSRPVLKTLTELLEQSEPAPSTWLERYGGSEPDRTEAPEPQGSRWWLNRARQLQVGDWVELLEADGERRRMRLVWGSDDALQFAFLSPQGMSESRFDLAEFVDRLAQGTAWLVEGDQIPFIDQSLFSIVEDVYRKLNFQATHDPLTGCMHRHDFEKNLAAVLASATARNAQGAVMLVDVDEFSVINASYGSGAGDQVLAFVGQTLKRCLADDHPDASVGRIGGNEFAIALANIPTEAGLDLADAIRRRFQDHVFDQDGLNFRITVSVAIKPIDSADTNAGELLNQASLALKSSKRKGGNRTELIRPSASVATKGATEWVSQIDRSIRDGSLYMRAQPIVPLDKTDQGYRQYELLLGLTDSSGREISPQGFIEAAEQYHRNSRVDLWVIREVMDWMRNNPSALADIDTFNVNLSGASLCDDSFMLDLEAKLRENADLAHKLCFEVTETSAVGNLHFAADFMREMKRLNCRFALDDFGTGLSSYAYLQRLPVDYVKIDGIFIRDIASNLTNYALVRSINELSHFLDMKTIAEYVEDMDIVETLREIQVDYAQGYAIAKPHRLDSLSQTTVKA